MGLVNWVRNKVNPAQPSILDIEGNAHPSVKSFTNFSSLYNTVEVVRRGVDLIVDSAAGIKVDVGNKIDNITANRVNVRGKRLNTLLNYQPNPYQSADVFKRNIFIDLVLEGNAFIYDDGAFLYNLPTENVEVVVDKKEFIKEFIFDSKIHFLPSEVIFIKENSTSMFRGESRLHCTDTTRKILQSMSSYQDNFFKNDAIPGIILKTPNVLSQKIKDRITEEWRKKYNPKVGGRRPVILDGDWSIENLVKSNFKELDFSESTKERELKLLKALGVPPILLDSGNNANIAPNQKLFYTSTVLPLYEKFLAGLEIHFGYDLKPNKAEIVALRPELRDESTYYTALVNSGIMSVNEARERLRLPPNDLGDELRIPVNIAGSAADPTQGGRPSGEDNA